jgi:hypothetical protein
MNAPVGVRKFVDGKLTESTVIESPSFRPPAPVEMPPAREAANQDDITDTNGLRKFLLKQMVAASKGELDTERTKNVCALVQQIYQATKLELEAARILQDSTKTIRAIALTTDD